jgi:hypothetical protein
MIEAPMLQFDWQQVDGLAMSAALGRFPQGLGDGTQSWEEIALIVGERTIALTVNNDTDEIIVDLLPSVPEKNEGWNDIAALAAEVGKEMGWSWVSRNSQGYLDTFSIAFNGIDPQYMFIAVASSIQCKKIVDIGANGMPRL